MVVGERVVAILEIEGTLDFVGLKGLWMRTKFMHYALWA